MKDLKTALPIHTDRLLIRLVEKDDWKDIRQIWKDFAASVYACYDVPHRTDEADVRPRIARWAAVNTGEGLDHLFFAVCLQDRVIGYVSCNRQDDGYEIGYAYSAASQGKGYAKESISALLKYMESCGVSAFYAGTALNNTPSVKLLSALGFRQTGTEQVSFYQDADGEPIYFEGGIYEKYLR